MITLDTNIFIYALDDRFPAKQAVAAEVVRHAARLDAPICLQVVGEAQNVARRKLKMPGFVAAQIGRNILGQFATFSPSVEDAEIALGQLAAGRLSYWDAILLACAQRAGCTALLSEDLQDGARILGIEIVNPFDGDEMSERARALLS
ncbi:PIN domain-containing protein [Brevundimonas staleyi]|uniref:PIN domain-containing protein n=1 Tax=Brevundimonas staleyi TaxID=74326 RepID=A0ABW0FNY2_9CAUL